MWWEVQAGVSGCCLHCEWSCRALNPSGIQEPTEVLKPGLVDGKQIAVPLTANQSTPPFLLRLDAASETFST